MFLSFGVFGRSCNRFNKTFIGIFTFLGVMINSNKRELSRKNIYLLETVPLYFYEVLKNNVTIPSLQATYLTSM